MTKEQKIEQTEQAKQQEQAQAKQTEQEETWYCNNCGMPIPKSIYDGWDGLCELCYIAEYLYQKSLKEKKEKEKR